MSKLTFPNISQNEDRQIIASWIFNNMIKNLTGEALEPQIIEKKIPENVETNYYDVNNALENELLNLETINNIIISGDVFYIKSFIVDFVKTIPRIKQNFKLLIKNISYLTPIQKNQLNDTTNRIILFITQIDENYQKIKNQGYTNGFSLENILSKYLTELKNISTEINNYVALNKNDMSAKPLEYINERSILDNLDDVSSELAENEPLNYDSEADEEAEEHENLNPDSTSAATPDFETPEPTKSEEESIYNQPKYYNIGIATMDDVEPYNPYENFENNEKLDKQIKNLEETLLSGKKIDLNTSNTINALYSLAAKYNAPTKDGENQFSYLTQDELNKKGIKAQLINNFNKWNDEISGKTKNK